MRSRKSLPPELLRPIPLPDEPLSASYLASYLTREWVKRFRHLLKHYGIKESEPDKWVLLLLKLACDHIRGFQLEEANRRRGGRPRKQAIRISRRTLQALRRKKLHDNILLAELIGEDRLRERGVRVTKKAAIEEGIRFMPALFGVRASEWRIRQTAAAWAKRLPEAEKFVPKSSKT